MVHSDWGKGHHFWPPTLFGTALEEQERPRRSRSAQGKDRQPPKEIERLSCTIRDLQRMGFGARLERMDRLAGLALEELE